MKKWVVEFIDETHIPVSFDTKEAALLYAAQFQHDSYEYNGEGGIKRIVHCEPKAYTTFWEHTLIVSHSILKEVKELVEEEA